MSWCDSCSAYGETDDAVCGSCGGELQREIESETRVGDSAPWHFWIVVVALAGYLGWRVVEGVLWVFG